MRTFTLVKYVAAVILFLLLIPGCDPSWAFGTQFYPICRQDANYAFIPIGSFNISLKNALRTFPRKIKTGRLSITHAMTCADLDLGENDKIQTVLYKIEPSAREANKLYYHTWVYVRFDGTVEENCVVISCYFIDGHNRNLHAEVMESIMDKYQKSFKQSS